ncbi:hypothetical protein AYO44_12205 [Planctomycetaceae bacterium SCGC AG-212-F19]|nr:hypothetical protein AYO44_12205 [Planctomycetaceae bacterium SCGC AG-212-F19]
MTDEQLLERFVSQRDAAAFEELVRRHGPMVMRVCQRALRHAQDAEDAFQATFIVLARKAHVIAKGSTASWLYGVAYRIALQTRDSANKHRAREQAVPDRALASPDQKHPGVTAEDRQALDEELHRLPEKFRAPLVLCYLEGKTTDETADQLGWSRGTVASRLSRARDRLRDRLSRRGVMLGTAAVATLLTHQVATAAVPAALGTATTNAAVAAVAGKAVGATAAAGALADSALKAMFWAKMKLYGLIMASAAVVAVPAVILLPPSDPGLVGHYAFAEGSGTSVKDASSSGNHGKLVGGVTWTTGRKPGSKALSFDGQTGHVKLAQDLSRWLGSSATVAFWLNTTQRGVPSDGFAVPGCVTGVDVSGNDQAVTTNDIQWGFVDETGRTGVCVGDLDLRRTKQMEEILVRSKQPINDGQWHHVALTRDATLGRVAVFVDGKLSGTTLTTAIGPKTSPFFSIGRKEVIPEQTKPAYHFQGLLSEVRFYNRVLKPEEIAALAQ